MEPDPEPAVWLPPACDQSGCCFQADGLARIAVFICIAAGTPRAVAAHLAHRAVGIVKPHGNVCIAGCLLQQDHAVCADAHVPVAQAAYKPRHVFRCKAERLFHRIENDKIIARAVHFGKVHAVSLPDVSDGIICRAGKKVNAKSC